LETLLQDILETCLEILEATQDGEDLSPHHLQLADDVRLGYEKLVTGRAVVLRPRQPE